MILCGIGLIPPMDHMVYCKWLRNDGLHTFLGMVGYCMKNNGEEHLEFVHLNVLVEDMNDDKMEYAKFGKVDLKVCVPFFIATSCNGATNGCNFV